MDFVNAISQAVSQPIDVVNYVRNRPKVLPRAAKFWFYSRFPIGANIFDRDWDLMVILDACRVDALEELADEYEFLPSEISTITSCGSSTLEWVSQTYTESKKGEISETTYVTANPWPERILSGKQSTEGFYNAEFAPTAWNTVSVNTFQNLFTILPDEDGYHQHAGVNKLSASEITGYAITASRETEWSRLLVHYMQPHSPYLATARKEGREELYDWELDFRDYLKEGGDRDVVWKSYLNELRAGLDATELLLQNVDAERVIITSDHGELFGRWFNYHPPGSLHPSLRRVPWVETTASDKQTCDSNMQFDSLTTESDVEKQLRALGYR